MAFFRFVVKLHDSGGLHFDFRIEFLGWLLSWVTVEGPSVDPKVPRYLKRVPDHDLKYLDREGLLPEGTHGAGPLMNWDIGTFEYVAKDVRKAFREGKIEIVLYGKRLRGRWTLLRTNEYDPDGHEWWLLIKEPDEHAYPGEPDKLIKMHNTSVTSGRTLEEIRNQKPDDERDDQPELF